MLKILLWFISKDTKYIKDAINILEQQHGGIKIVGKAVGEEISTLDKDFDVVLIAGAKKIGMNKIIKAANQLNLLEEKLLGDWIACTPGFTLEKYRKLQNSRLSIFAMNCFGGEISHTLGLPFRSPLVNLFFKEQEFISFLRKPRTYMKEKLILNEKKIESMVEIKYPIVKLGDVDLYMNHYPDFDTAVELWEQRKARISWYNLFVTMYTENEEILQEFDSLPYGKKVCFVPFKSKLNSAWYINPKNLPLGEIINHFGFGNPFYYDPFDMLLYGKKTPLIDM